MDTLCLWTRLSSADPIAHSLTRLEYARPFANDFRDMNEEIRSAVVGCDKAEARLTVKPLDDPVVNRIHGFQHRFDVEVLGDGHHSSSVPCTHRFHSHFGGKGTKVIKRRGRRSRIHPSFLVGPNGVT